TCHILSSDALAEVPGMCGVVDGGVVAGRWGYEAGQSGVGDIFAWFVSTGVPAAYSEAAAAKGQNLHEYLTDLASAQPIGAHGLVALDWHSGNRSTLVDHELSGLVLGQTLATRPEDIYRALLESTAFGTRTIIEAFLDSGVEVRELVVAGGLLKNRFLMQMYADVTRLPLSTIVSEQGPALGSAIHAAVAAGRYPDVPTAAAAMGGRVEAAYTPDPAASDAYDRLYAEYRTLYDYFGRGANEVMHRLKAIRREAHAAQGGATAPAAPEREPTEDIAGPPPPATTPTRTPAAARSCSPSSRWSSRTPCRPPANGSPRCTASWCATSWSSGPPATSASGCPARSRSAGCSSSSPPASPTTSCRRPRWSS